jgi:hypothetical protein
MVIGMTQIKAIPTEYAGCRFRSRLEARWAVFFDTLGIKWQYEHEGYQTSAGWYLPDFSISMEHVQPTEVEFRMLFAEVKGAEIRQGEADRCAALTGPGGLDAYVLTLGRIPDPRSVPICELSDVQMTGWWLGGRYPVQLFRNGYPFRLAGKGLSGMGRDDLESIRGDFAEPIQCSHQDGYLNHQCIRGVRPPLSDALRAARSARFGVHE